MNSVQYTEETWEIVSHMMDGNFILLMTATDLETNTLHKYFHPLSNYSFIIKFFNGSQTYYLGKFGNYKVAHVQCGIGSMSPGGSILTAREAIELLKPKFLLIIGIAFGIDDKKQKIGDILVSEAIIPYNFKRVGKEQTIQRSAHANASITILNRFKNLRTWEHFIDEQSKSKSEMICGHILSGEELIDNKSYRDDLLKDNPTAIGGEMEGAGVFSACEGKLEWIIVKGICDFADGNKYLNKDENQRIAITSAISACLEIFSSKNVFEVFGIKINDEYTLDNSILPTNEDINSVLFDLYNNNYENYYIIRLQDGLFLKDIAQHGVWLSGPTGCGKTNLILRNLINSQKLFIQISLASCIGQSIDAYFNEILLELRFKTGGINDQNVPDTYRETHKAIINFLDNHYSQQELVVFIEEIPIEIDSEYQEFTEKMLSLLISKSYNQNIINVKFVLSSINNPSKHIPLFQHKILQQMKFQELKYWDSKDTEKLIEVIISKLKINLEKEFLKRLNSESKGSPRMIKKFFRNLLAQGKVNMLNPDEIIKETKRELNIS